jgi:hypothetical protein
MSAPGRTAPFATPSANGRFLRTAAVHKRRQRRARRSYRRYDRLELRPNMTPPVEEAARPTPRRWSWGDDGAGCRGCLHPDRYALWWVREPPVCLLGLWCFAWHSEGLRWSRPLRLGEVLTVAPGAQRHHQFALGPFVYGAVRIGLRLPSIDRRRHSSISSAAAILEAALDTRRSNLACR